MSYFFFAVNSTDDLRDACALIRAALEDDIPAALAILDGCDLREVAAVLASFGAASAAANHGSKDAAIAWLADAQAELNERDRGTA